MYFDLIVVALVLITTIVFYVWYSRAQTRIKSSIDGRIYTVKNNELMKQSADLLANVNARLTRLISYIKEINPPITYAANLEKFDPNNTHENILNIDTTYTLDKGKSMLFCIGPRDEKIPRLYDLNTMMYVAVHELSHIASDSIGHTVEFKQKFADILNKAIAIGVYRYVDYSKEPIEYCGMKLTRNILGSK